jgi:hypothetical protein
MNGFSTFLGETVGPPRPGSHPSQRPRDVLGPVMGGAVGALFPAPGPSCGVAGRDHGSGAAGPGELHGGGADIARAAVEEEGLPGPEPCLLQPDLGG